MFAYETSYVRFPFLILNQLGVVVEIRKEREREEKRNFHVHDSRPILPFGSEYAKI